MSRWAIHALIWEIPTCQTELSPPALKRNLTVFQVDIDWCRLTSWRSWFETNSSRELLLGLLHLLQVRCILITILNQKCCNLGIGKERQINRWDQVQTGIIMLICTMETWPQAATSREGSTTAGVGGGPDMSGCPTPPSPSTICPCPCPPPTDETRTPTALYMYSHLL